MMKKIFLILIVLAVIGYQVRVPVFLAVIEWSIEKKCDDLGLSEELTAELVSLAPRISEGLKEDLFNERELKFIKRSLHRIREAEAIEAGIIQANPVTDDELKMIIEKTVEILAQHDL